MFYGYLSFARGDSGPPGPQGLQGASGKKGNDGPSGPMVSELKFYVTQTILVHGFHIYIIYAMKSHISLKLLS